jgi:hypothetical protein
VGRKENQGVRFAAYIEALISPEIKIAIFHFSISLRKIAIFEKIAIFGAVPRTSASRGGCLRSPDCTCSHE